MDDNTEVFPSCFNYFSAFSFYSISGPGLGSWAEYEKTHFERRLKPTPVINCLQLLYTFVKPNNSLGV